MENEFWLPVHKKLDKNGRYHVSNLGRIKRLGYFTKIKGEWKPDLIIKYSTAGRYPRYKIGSKTISIHRIVCMTFHPNPENKPQVNHKDNNKKNNHADNLEWCTQSENIRHAQSIGVMPYAKPKVKVYKLKKDKKHKPPIKVINIETGDIYNSVDELCKLKGLNAKNIRRQISGERYCHLPYRYVGREDQVKIKPQKPLKPIKTPLVRPHRKQYIPHPLVLKKIIQFNVDGSYLKTFDSVKEAAISVGSNKHTFRKAIKKSPNNFTKGFIWKYADNS